MTRGRAGHHHSYSQISLGPQKEAAAKQGEHAARAPQSGYSQAGAVAHPVAAQPVGTYQQQQQQHQHQHVQPHGREGYQQAAPESVYGLLGQPTPPAASQLHWQQQQQHQQHKQHQQQQHYLQQQQQQQHQQQQQQQQQQQAPGAGLQMQMAAQAQALHHQKEQERRIHEQQEMIRRLQQEATDARKQDVANLQQQQQHQATVPQKPPKPDRSTPYEGPSNAPQVSRADSGNQLSQTRNRAKGGDRESRQKSKEKRDREAAESSRELQETQARKEKDRMDRVAKARREELERKESEKIARRERAREDLDRKELDRKREAEKRKQRLGHTRDTKAAPPSNDTSSGDQEAIERLMDDLRREKQRETSPARSKTADTKRIPPRLEPLQHDSRSKPLTAPAHAAEAPLNGSHKSLPPLDRSTKSTASDPAPPQDACPTTSPLAHPQPPDPVWQDGDVQYAVDESMCQHSSLDTDTSSALWGFLQAECTPQYRQPSAQVDRTLLQHAASDGVLAGAQVDALWAFLTSSCPTVGGAHTHSAGVEPEMPGGHQMISSAAAAPAAEPRRRMSIARDRLSQLRKEAAEQIVEELQQSPHTQSSASPAPSPLHEAPTPIPRKPSPPDPKRPDTRSCRSPACRPGSAALSVG